MFAKDTIGKKKKKKRRKVPEDEKKNRRKKWIWQNFLVTQSSRALAGAIFARVQAKQRAKVGSA